MKSERLSLGGARLSLLYAFRDKRALESYYVYEICRD